MQQHYILNSPKPFYGERKESQNNAIENLGTIRKIDLILKLFNTKGNNFLKFQTSKKFKIPKFPKII
jgi:hypothetical protein